MSIMTTPTSVTPGFIAEAQTEGGLGGESDEAYVSDVDYMRSRPLIGPAGYKRKLHRSFRRLQRCAWVIAGSRHSPKNPNGAATSSVVDKAHYIKHRVANSGSIVHPWRHCDHLCPEGSHPTPLNGPTIHLPPVPSANLQGD